MLVSVTHSGLRDARDRRSYEARMIFRHHTLHPGGLNVNFTSSKVSARCKRCDFCFYWNVTLHRLFFSCSQTNDEEGVPSKRLANIYNFCAQI